MSERRTWEQGWDAAWDIVRREASDECLERLSTHRALPATPAASGDVEAAWTTFLDDPRWSESWEDPADILVKHRPRIEAAIRAESGERATLDRIPRAIGNHEKGYRGIIECIGHTHPTTSEARSHVAEGE